MKCIFLVLASLSLVSKALSFDASPACFRDLELNFFQPAIVQQAFSIQGVDQSIWVPIIQNLQTASKNVPKALRDRAEGMDPNPFDPVFIPDAAHQLLMDVLYQIFSDTLITYNPNQVLRLNGNDISTMFNYIINQQSQRIDRCFGPIKK